MSTQPRWEGPNSRLGLRRSGRRAGQGQGEATLEPELGHHHRNSRVLKDADIIFSHEIDIFIVIYLVN